MHTTVDHIKVIITYASVTLTYWMKRSKTNQFSNVIHSLIWVKRATQNEAHSHAGGIVLAAGL